jgi:hypothetical protein
MVKPTATSGHDDGQAGRDSSQVEGKPRTAGHHQVSEHALGEVDRSGGATERGGHDEAEDEHHPGDQIGEDVVAAGRTVGVRRNGVGQQAAR